MKLRLIHYSNLGTASWTAISRWSLSSDRSHSVIALDESTLKTPLYAACQNVGTGFLCTLRSSMPHTSLSFEIRASQSAVCTSSSGRFKENSTNEIRLLKSWPGIQNEFFCVGGPCHCSIKVEKTKRKPTYVQQSCCFQVFSSQGL